MNFQITQNTNHFVASDLNCFETEEGFDMSSTYQKSQHGIKKLDQFCTWVRILQISLVDFTCPTVPWPCAVGHQEYIGAPRKRPVQECNHLGLLPKAPGITCVERLVKRRAYNSNMQGTQHVYTSPIDEQKIRICSSCRPRTVRDSGLSCCKNPGRVWCTIQV